MSGEIVRRLGTEAERRYAQELSEIDRQTALTKRELRAVSELTAEAMFEQVKINMTQAVVTELNPDGAADYAMLATIGRMQLAKVLGQGL